MSSGPTPSPTRLLINRKLAEAVARIGRGTRCWTAVVTGPSHRMLSALATSSSGQASHRFGASRPSAKAGAVISQAIAGSFAYQPRSTRAEAVGEPAPGEHAGAAADQEQRGEEIAGRRRPRPKLRISTDGVHSARP